MHISHFDIYSYYPLQSDNQCEPQSNAGDSWLYVNHIYENWWCII